MGYYRQSVGLMKSTALVVAFTNDFGYRMLLKAVNSSILDMEELR
jgi:hypothetical protein